MTPSEPPTRNRWLDRLLNPSRVVGNAVNLVQSDIIPAWRSTYPGERSEPVLLALVVASVLQAVLPTRVVHPVRWLFPSVAAALLVVLVAAHGARIHRASPVLRLCTLLFMLVLSGANIAAAYRLITDLLNGEGTRDAGDLLLYGAAIWLTNVIIFALWYWMFDRGGPVARALNPRPYPDFLFPQMGDERLAKPGWRPEFFDYLYTSFTNATAFSPTDVMPMSRWAKLTMMLQSSVALLLAILVIARAVNILK